MAQDLRRKFVDGLLGFFIIFVIMSALIALIRVVEPLGTGVLSVLVFVGAGVYIFARSTGRIARLWCVMWPGYPFLY